MNCDQLKASIHGYVDRRLAPDLREAFERHLGECPTCKELVEHVLELPCRDFVQFLDDYFEERLPEEQRRIFDKHMELCPPCLDYLRSYERTVELGRICGGREAPPPDVPQALIDAILKARRADPGG